MHSFDTGEAPATVVGILARRARLQPARRAYTFLPDGLKEGPGLTYGELDRQARALAASLAPHSTPGDRALLLYPQSLEFIVAFFGCLYAGIVAIPAYPPRPNQSGLRIFAIAEDAKPRLALTTSALLTRSQAQFAQAGRIAPMHWISTDEGTADLLGEWLPPEVNGDTLAYLQYTSGSTATPKGVTVTHSNLLHNLFDLDEGWEHTPESILVTWLPTFHDMGLVYGILEPLYRGFHCFLMPPLAFLQHPARWLRAISDRRATHSVGPNFAYELCVRKVKPEERVGLDLSSWVAAVNGAEPVRRETLERFRDMFAPCGFRWKAFCPGFGLAEATLKVTATRSADDPVFCSVEADSLEKHRIKECSPSQPGGRTFVGCGRAEGETGVAIVNPETLTLCARDEVGEIWVSGPSLTRGYWGRPEETSATFWARLSGTGDGPFLRTGDLGFQQNGVLYVTGRLKDLIIIRGQNHYPQDIELTVAQCHPALRRGCGIAFSVDARGEERLIIVQEAGLDHENPQSDELVKTIRQAVAEGHELQAYSVVLLKPGAIPKTSSGKVQRQACRIAYLAGTLEVWGNRKTVSSTGSPLTAFRHPTE
jgi:acyl-CoA synthetase (AMP-forming)/AMP-acid ligase II